MQPTVWSFLPCRAWTVSGRVTPFEVWVAQCRAGSPPRPHRRGVVSASLTCEWYAVARSRRAGVLEAPDAAAPVSGPRNRAQPGSAGTPDGLDNFLCDARVKHPRCLCMLSVTDDCAGAERWALRHVSAASVSSSYSRVQQRTAWLRRYVGWGGHPLCDAQHVSHMSCGQALCGCV